MKREREEEEDGSAEKDVKMIDELESIVQKAVENKDLEEVFHLYLNENQQNKSYFMRQDGDTTLHFAKGHVLLLIY